MVERSIVSMDTLLRGAWYAMEQCGINLQDSNLLFENRRYSNAGALALLAREELGRAQILFQCWKEGEATQRFYTPGEIKKLCGDHVSKLKEGQLSTTLRAAPGSPVAQLVETRLKTQPGSADYEKADREIALLHKAIQKRTPQDRIMKRISLSYVDIDDSGSSWNRPCAVASEEVFALIVEAISDYRARVANLSQTNQGPRLSSALAQFPDLPRLPDVMPPRIMEAMGT